MHHVGARPDRAGAALWPLADRIARRSIGLVLAGGGARGLAHLGVLHALDEAGVRIDRVAGTSSGALVAAAYASYGSARAADEAVFEEMVVAEPTQGWRPSRQSLKAGDRIVRGLERSFAGQRIEALGRELVVVSTDIYARTPVYHRTGPVADALAASSALPVLFPARRVDGRVLVDGGLTDNLPTGALADLDEGPLVAVRIAPPPSAGAPRRMPGIPEVLLRVVELADRDGTADAVTPAVTVIPDTRGIGLLEFHQIDAARDAGRRAGELAVAALVDALGSWVTART